MQRPSPLGITLHNVLWVYVFASTLDWKKEADRRVNTVLARDIVDLNASMQCMGIDLSIKSKKAYSNRTDRRNFHDSLTISSFFFVTT